MRSRGAIHDEVWLVSRLAMRWDGVCSRGAIHEYVWLV